ncbi:hypothetical protein [Clostridium boliviensis]|uniref:hypothetical protein n=1 Tax=Clostridium boliviensis TaxID=318465 RepID=UPI003F6C824A
MYEWHKQIQLIVDEIDESISQIPDTALILLPAEFFTFITIRSGSGNMSDQCVNYNFSPVRFSHFKFLNPLL